MLMTESFGEKGLFRWAGVTNRVLRAESLLLWSERARDSKCSSRGQIISLKMEQEVEGAKECGWSLAVGKARKGFSHKPPE